jgi:hypothetical protein
MMAEGKRPRGLAWQSSKTFIICVTDFSVFSDLVLYGALVPYPRIFDLMWRVPAFPFALGERSGIPEDAIQRSVSQLLAVYALGSLLTKYTPIMSSLTCTVLSWDGSPTEHLHAKAYISSAYSP